MSSSSSSPSSAPSVSVVIGSNAPPESLEACLTALEPQVDDSIEVRVLSAHATPTTLRERFPWASFAEQPGALVPELWRDGIDGARGDVVALTIAQMQPAPNWIEQVRAQLGRFDAVGGAIELGARLRPTDWAEYFCRYASDIPPFEARESIELPGDNAAYRRELLVSVADEYRDGFWELEVHMRLAARGAKLWHAPELVVRQGRSCGWRAFALQRLRHGRKFGRQRGSRFSRTRNVVGALVSPAVPFLMTVRVLRQVLQKRRYRLRALASLPLIFSFNLVWAYAEARGHLDLLRR